MLTPGNIYTWLTLAQLTDLAQAALHYPNALISRLEHLLVDTDGAFRAGFKDAITPCTNYVSGAQTLGRQTSAQWLRVAFHDFVTAHVDEGTGGIDASIGFETLRAEDSGSAFNDSFAFFAPFVDAQTSMADLVALSVVASLGNCGGLRVPLRGGRVDAAADGPLGVPEPESGLDETLAEFAGAGFDARDTVGLTACGHSLGRVHHGGFPNVVPASAVTPDNTGGGVDLDSTRASFDVDVVREYLGGYGQRGGPLVTSENVTVRSDLRLYESDGNATMEALGASSEEFFETCRGLFERMINTVPKGVVLSEVVEPVSVKPVNFTFDITGGGMLALSGTIRSLSPDGTAPASINISLGNAGNESIASRAATAASDSGSNLRGTTTFYPTRFELSVDELSSADNLPSKLHVVMPSPRTFALQPEAFFVPSISSVGTSATTIGAAVFNGTASPVKSVAAVLSVPSPQMGTLAPKVVELEVPLQKYQDVGPYFLFKGSMDGDGTVNSQASIDIVVTFEDGSVIRDEYDKLSFI
ncbi:hypothetical protein SLS56_000764 [Neofusicoccum ribis]|uniref:Peroxidase n=1 Tax=Neofusicoccum ribis TaxID=45134 RepID=A0ABR3TCA3_9PEZI